MRKLTFLLAFAVAALALSAQVAPRFEQNADAPAQQPYLTVPSLPGAPAPGKAVARAGAAQLPFSRTFMSEDKLDGFAVVDGNNDSRKFQYYDAEHCLRLQAPTRGTGEDYLVLPSVDMEKNYSYEFKVQLASATDKGSKVSLIVAKGSTITALREAVDVVELTATEAVYPDWQNFTGEYTCEESGEYYFALKCANTSSMSTLYVNSVEVGRGILKIEPMAPMNVTCVSAEDGSPLVTITWEPPTDYWNYGGPITEPLFFDIWSDTGKKYLARDIPAAYPVTTWVDNNPVMGENVYVVIAKTARIEGGYTYVATYVGFTIPADVTGAASTQGANTGMASITWTPVTHDANGRKILETVNHDVYQLWSGGQAIVGNDITDGQLKVQALNPTDPQVFFTYVLFARTSKGRSGNYTYCEPLGLGKPHTLPYLESWAGRGISHPISTGTDAYAQQWFTCGERTYNEFGPVDGDDGYTIFYAGSQTESPVSSLLLGLFHIDAEAENPLFTIYTLAQWAAPNAPSYNYLTLDADLHDGNGYQPIGLFSTNAEELGVPDLTWVGQSLPLADLKGKDVHLRLTATNINYYVTAFDKMHIFDCTEYNASNVRISGPEQLTPGYASTFTVQVDNYGRQPLTPDNYTVELLFNGEVVASKPGPAIASMGMTGTVTFDWAPNCFNAVGMVAPKAKITARVVCPADKSQDDNSSATLEIPIVATTWPIATDVTAGRDGSGKVTVAWAEPELTGLPLQKTFETFEDYDMPSKTGFGDWKLYDGDGGPCAASRVGVAGAEQNEPLSFIIFNFSPTTKQFYAHSGSHCIGAVYNYDRSAQQDWIISPELTGEKQTVTFWAKSHPTQLSEMYEKYELLTIVYSTTDDQPESFTVALQEDTPVPFEWTKMQFTVPEGAKHFALVCTSIDCYMLLIDDIEFTRADAEPVDLQVKGYNIYRDGVLAGTAPAGALTYEDTTPEAASSAAYQVAVAYNLGESKAVKANVTSGIAEAQAGSLQVAVEGHAIVASDPEGRAIAIASADGRSVACGIGQLRADVAPGVYVVCCGAQAVKVIVK